MVQSNIPDKILDFCLFGTLNEAREITERWLMAESQNVRGTKAEILTFPLPTIRLEIGGFNCL